MELSFATVAIASYKRAQSLSRYLTALTFCWCWWCHDLFHFATLCIFFPIIFVCVSVVVTLQSEKWVGQDGRGLGVWFHQLWFMNYKKQFSCLANTLTNEIQFTDGHISSHKSWQIATTKPAVNCKIIEYSVRLFEKVFGLVSTTIVSVGGLSLCRCDFQYFFWLVSHRQNRQSAGCYDRTVVYHRFVFITVRWSRNWSGLR